MLHYIGVIGSGTMGSGIAQVCAQSGIRVIVVDVEEAQLDRAKQTIEKSVGKLVDKGVLSKAQGEQALHGITFSTHMEDLSDVDAVIEAIVEIKEKKVDVLHQVESICKPSVIIGSNTSSISINELGSVLKRPENFMGVHFFNPVPIMKLVELVRGKETSKKTYESFHALALQLHKDPATVNDAPGFISNRVLMPMINEAVLALEEGVASKEDIDKVMKLGMAHPMGPLTLADLIGIDVCRDIMHVLYAGFGDEKYKPAKLFEDMIAKGWLGRKSGRGFYDYSPK